MVHGASSSSERPPHGTMAEEAFKLAEVAQLWLMSKAAPPGGDTWAAATDGLGHAPECRGCPVCRVIRFVRDLNPEVIEHLSEAATSLAAAVAAMGGRDEHGRHEHASEPTDDS
jgi:hypothetical protein